MRVYKSTAGFPSSPIYSISIDRSDSYVAVGRANGRIELWSHEQFKAVTTFSSPSKDILDNIEPIVVLNYHEGSEVNVVVFSKEEDYLISGDSKGKVYLIEKPWILNATPRLLVDLYSPEFIDDFSALANFTRKLPQRKPDDEEDCIMDICWHDRLIAISSLNSKVLIYDFKYQRFVGLLNSFKSQIKSLSLDPTDNFLIVACNDRNLYVYQYKFKQFLQSEKFYIVQIHKVSKLLQNTLLTTKFNRFNWSPTGNLFSVPNGTREIGKLPPALIDKTLQNNAVINISSTDINHTYSLNNVTIVALLSPLNDFKNISSLIGHQFSSLESVKFNPKLWKVTDTPKPSEINSNIKNDRFCTIMATGGLDKTLVIWSSVVEKPIFVAEDFTNNDIIDICWTNNGLGLFVGSMDGSLNYLQFTPEELGIMASEEDLKTGIAEVSKMIPELDDPTEWKALIEEEEKVCTLFPKSASLPPSTLKSPISPVSASSSNKEIKQATPTPTSPELNTSAPKIDVTNDKNNNNNVSTARQNGSYKTPTITKNGKKRVSTILVSSYGNKNDTLTKRSTTSNSQINNVSHEFDKPSNLISKKIVNSEIKKDSDEPNNKRQKTFEPIDFMNVTVVNPLNAFARLRLAIPKVQLNISYKSLVDPLLSLIIRNGSGNEQKPTRISLVRGHQENKEVFVDFSPKLINIVAGGEGKFWAVACLDGSLLIYSPTGKRLFPPMMLGSSLSFLESKGDYLMAVTSIGDLYVWNVSLKKNIIKPVNLYSLFEPFNKYQDELIVKGDSLTLCSINSNGVPLVTLANGNGYLYDKDMEAWCLISDSWWVFGSHYWDSTNKVNDTNESSSSISINEKSSIISLIETRTDEEVFKKRRTNLLKKVSKIMLMKHGYENLEISISLAHLENRILIAERLQEKQEFKKLLVGYCVRISELAYKSRLIEVFQDLLGPKQEVSICGDDGLDVISSDDDEDDEDIINQSQKGNGKQVNEISSLKTVWESTVCGLSKHALLKDIILACARNRDVQRVLVSYGKAIGLLEDEILA